MSSNLRNHLQDLASTFAASVLEALRGASLEEILAESRGAGASAGRRGAGRASFAKAAKAAPEAAPRGAARRRGGRLSRRSADDIAELVERIVGLLGSNPDGLRAEQIRDALGLEAKELPRPLAEALSHKRITKKGHKRATTYFASGRGAKASSGDGAGRGRGRAAKKSTGRGRAAKGKRSAKRGRSEAQETQSAESAS